jgi:hypothetical protein
VSWARSRIDAGGLPYLILAGALFGLMLCESVVQTVDGSWVGDFWEHSAVVRELARHLVHPQHPLLSADKPHEFYSPYALTLGAFSRVTGLSAVTVLGLAGIGNLALLLAALPRFVRLFARQALAPFFALVFMLFLWGRHPLVYSGFLHFDVLGLVLPYPSTFATALTLWTLPEWTRYLDGGGLRRLVAVAVAGTLIVLTHPIAGLFFVVLASAIALRHFARAAARPAVGLVVVAGVTLVSASLWPYYPVFRLIGEGGVFDASNHPLYQSVLVEVFPALAGLPLLAIRWRRDRRDPLVLGLVVLAFVYLLGATTSRWSLGRVLPYGVLLLDIALAGWAASIVTRARSACLAAAVVVAVAWPLMALTGPAARTLPRGVFSKTIDRYRPESVGESYSRLFAGVPRSSVTMARGPAGWPVPTYGGRIVAPLNPQAFVGDLAQRDRDASTFFADRTGSSTRQALLCRYGARYVLVDARFPGAKVSALSKIAHVIGARSTYVLLEASRAC